MIYWEQCSFCSEGEWPFSQSFYNEILGHPLPTLTPPAWRPLPVFYSSRKETCRTSFVAILVFFPHLAYFLLMLSSVLKYLCPLFFSFILSSNSYGGVLQPQVKRVDVRGQNERASLRSCRHSLRGLHVHFRWATCADSYRNP